MSKEPFKMPLKAKFAQYGLNTPNDDVWKVVTANGLVIYRGKKDECLFICLCCNRHDALVEACKYTKILLSTGTGQCTHALALIEAAIAGEPQTEGSKNE